MYPRRKKSDDPNYFKTQLSSVEEVDRRFHVFHVFMRLESAFAFRKRCHPTEKGATTKKPDDEVGGIPKRVPVPMSKKSGGRNHKSATPN